MKKPILYLVTLLAASANLRAQPVTNWHTFKNAPATTLSGQGTSSPVFGAIGTTASTAFLIGYLDAPLTLVNIGDKISFTYDLRFNDEVGMATTAADNFRFALFDLNGEARATIDNTDTAGTVEHTDNLRGYWFGVKSGGGAQGSIRKRTGTTTDLNAFANASAPSIAPTPPAGGTSITYSGAVNGVGGELYSGSMTLELQTNGVALSGFFAGNGATNIFSVVDTNSPFTANFEAVAFLNGGALNADQVLFENITVTLIPFSAAPALTITKNGNNVELSWPSAGLFLQSTPSLSDPITWTIVPDSNTTNFVSQPLGIGPVFYRLSDQIPD